MAETTASAITASGSIAAITAAALERNSPRVNVRTSLASDYGEAHGDPCHYSLWLVGGRITENAPSLAKAPVRSRLGCENWLAGESACPTVKTISSGRSASGVRWPTRT